MSSWANYHKVVHTYIKNGVVFINILFIYINIIKPWHKKKTVWLSGAWERTPLVTLAVSPSTCGLWWYGWGHIVWGPSSHNCQSYGFLLRLQYHRRDMRIDCGFAELRSFRASIWELGYWQLSVFCRTLYKHFTSIYVTLHWGYTIYQSE